MNHFILKFYHKSIILSLLKLSKHINNFRKKQFLLLLVLMIVVSIVEVAGIGAVFPFLAILIDPNKYLINPRYDFVFAYLDIKSVEELIILVTIIFGIVVILVAILRVFLLWALSRFSLMICGELASQIYLKTLYQPYQTHISRNSSEIINGITSYTNSVIYDTVLPTMTLISSLIMSIIILCVMIIFIPGIAFIIFSIFGLTYFGILQFTKKRIAYNSKVLSRESFKIVKSIQEGLGAIRDILLDGSQMAYWRIYQESNMPLRVAQASIAFIGSCPRFIIEAFGMLVIAFLTLYFVKSGADHLLSIVPVIGLIALGAQRLLPIFQQIYSSLISIRSGQETLNAVLSLLDKPLANYLNISSQKIEFSKFVRFENISYRYNSNSSEILKNINLIIKKGDRIGIIGKTGSGKSTLLDILMCLLEPSSGFIEVDGIKISPEYISGWRKNIAHVPQTIYLADLPILQNIAFGIEKDQIDLGRVITCAKHAQLFELIESLPNKYQTLVGERGVQLSGGQRQRIGIARALYKQAKIIIFDEATSALDNETEANIINSIESLDKDLTLIMITHRITTLKNCSTLINLDNGKIKIIYNN